MKYQKTTLKNGLRVVTIPMAGTQTATVMIMVGVGSRFEKQREAGLSHFIEHMLFKGTEKRPTTLSISEELDGIGGEFNAFTSKDSTAYYAKVDAKHIDTAIDVLADMYLHSKLEAEEIEREKGTIIQELNMYEDTPVRYVSDVFESLLYGEHELGREIVGTKKTIAGFRRKDFVSYMERYYHPNNTVICVAGKFDQKQIISLMRKYFNSLENGKSSSFAKIVEKQKAPAVKIKYKKTDQTHLVLGVRSFDKDHKDRFVQALLSVILGGNMSSRLFIEVRERRGLAYSVRTDVEAYADCGYLAAQAGVEHRNLKLTVETILKEYSKISTEKVTEKELQMAKDYLKGKAVMSFEASDEVAMFFIEQEMKRKKILSLEEMFRKIDAVTAEDILRVAKEIFQASKLNLAVIGPHGNATELEKILQL